jgi:GNAT superfamily N-acetyltransferase
MTFADLNLSRRLERAEGRSCLEFAEARGRLHPESGATWMECAGAYAVFDGVNSPVTQSFGLGLFEPLSPTALDKMEAFFLDRGALVVHEVSPLAGTATKTLPDRVTVRVAGAEEAALWTQLSSRGWGHEHPELLDFLGEFGSVAFAREHTVNFLAELDGRAGAAGALSLHDGVALFAGATTIPEMRRHGLQAALLEARMGYAFEHGYPLAMMVTEAGSQSQRNAERKGFRIAYTRTKWQLYRS